nr:hypothetical protein [Tanacetum cinerariifolium]
MCVLTHIRIATELEEDPSMKLMPASIIIRPDPDELVRVEFMINGKIVYLTKQDIQEYWDNEEKMKKATKKTKLIAMSRPEVIKVICEEAKKLEIDPKDAISTKAELGIQSALPALVPKQVSSQTLGKKKKHMELEPKIKVPGLKSNRSLPEGVPFFNNMVIE